MAIPAELTVSVSLPEECLKRREKAAEASPGTRHSVDALKHCWLCMLVVSLWVRLGYDLFLMPRERVVCAYW